MSEIPRQSEQDTEPATEKAGEKTDVALSPEIIEKIMAKVQDIDMHGIAYTMVRGISSSKGYDHNFEFLKPILKYGLLGREESERPETIPVPEDWIRNTRKNRKTVIYFNITGTLDSHKRERDKTEIESSYYLKGSGPKVTLLFDQSHFKEEEITKINRPKEDYDLYKHKNPFPKNRTYRLGRQQHDSFEGYKEHGLVDDEYGFILSHRIAPRFFKGALVRLSRKINSQEIEERFNNMMEQWYSSHRDEARDKEFREMGILHNHGKTEEEMEYEDSIRKKIIEGETEDTNPERLSAEAQKIAQMMQEIYGGKESLLIPIYDIHGNLWWPKQMSHEEVKKFVAERDKKE